MAEHPPRNDDKKSAKQRGGRSHPKVKGTIDALVAELNNIQSRNSLKKVGADVVTPEGAAAAGIGEASTVPPELKQIYGDAPVPRDKVAILKKIKGKEKIASFLAQTAADVAERKSSAGNVEVKPSQTASAEPALIAEAPKAEESTVQQSPESELDKAKKKTEPVPLAQPEVVPTVVEPVAAPATEKKSLEADNTPAPIVHVAGGEGSAKNHDDYEKQRISLESGFRKLFPHVDMSNEEQNKAYAEFTVLRRELSKSFNAGSPEITEAKINAFLTSHVGTIETEKRADEQAPGSADKTIEVQVAPVASSEPLSSKQAEVASEPVQVETVPVVQEKERKLISLAEIEDIVREKLKGKAEITNFEITETPKGLQIDAELQHPRAKKILLQGLIVNNENTIDLQGLNITAEKWQSIAKSTITKGLAGFDEEIKKYFESQSGKPISSIQVGPSGLVVEFESPKEILESDTGGRIEPTLEPEIEQREDQNTQQEGTPKENRSKFLETMTRAKEVFGGMTEAVSERFTKSKNYLNERAKQIDAQAQTSGGERIVRRMGEIYNKLNWREKLGIGLVLGAGAVVTGGASIYVPYAFVGAIGMQRAFGMASMYLSQEKALLNAKIAESEQFISAKERAAFDAVMSGALMGAAIGKGIQLANEYGLVERTRELLGNMLGHFKISASEIAKPAPTIPANVVARVSGDMLGAETHHQVPGAMTAEQMLGAETHHQPLGAAEVPQPAAAAAAGEEVSRPVAQHIPRPEAPTSFEMPKHADFSIHEDDTTISPYDVTPTDQSGADDDIVQVSEESQPVAESEAVTETTRSMPVSQEAPAEPIESQPEAINEPLQNVKVPEPETYEKLDLTPEQTEVSTTPEALVVETPTTSTETPVTHTETPAPTTEPFAEQPQSTDAIPETQPPAPVVEKSIISNQFGLAIPVAEPHIYAGADAGHTFAFGGTPTERASAILQYLKENPNKVVFGPDDTNTYRVPWHLVEGKLTPGAPMRTNGLFGFLSTWMKPPGPEDFEKIIK